MTFSTPALRVGRQIDCEILLNHPSVSRLHAGINEIDGRFYLINLSQSHPVTLNGRLVEFNEPEALADGDMAQIGSFYLHMNRTGESLNIHVRSKLRRTSQRRLSRRRRSNRSRLNQWSRLRRRWPTRSRNFGTSARAIRPRARRRFIRNNPRDPARRSSAGSRREILLRPWPVSVFIWATVIIGAISVAAAFWYAQAFSPAPVSHPHAQAALVHQTPDDGDCEQAERELVHDLSHREFEYGSSCASCHQTEAFAAVLTGIPAHAEAGIGCNSCHAEHQGADFRPAEARCRNVRECHTKTIRLSIAGDESARRMAERSVIRSSAAVGPGRV